MKVNYRKDIYEKVKFMLKENPEANINCSKLARIYGCDRRTISKNIDIVKNNMPPPKLKRAKKTDGFEQIIEEKVKTGAPAIAICNYLKKHHGYTGSYTIIKDFIRIHTSFSFLLLIFLNLCGIITTKPIGNVCYSVRNVT